MQYERAIDIAVYINPSFRFVAADSCHPNKGKIRAFAEKLIANPISTLMMASIKDPRFDWLTASPDLEGIGLLAGRLFFPVLLGFEPIVHAIFPLHSAD